MLASEPKHLNYILIVKNIVQKSIVFTFVLLLSSLIMLSAMPLLNNNNNTAMAQGDDTYGYNSYSKYPTEDKKYECRTGPFEGFFTSSVEFCKHVKFDKDDRKDVRDNKTGTQGPPGAAITVRGPAGLTGPQGPAGPNQINNTNLYLNLGNLSFLFPSPTTPSPIGLSIVTCDTGDVVFEGGHSLLDFSPSNPPFIISEGPLPFPFSTYTGPKDSAYHVLLQVPGLLTSSGFTTFIAYAYCFDNPPTHIP